MANTPWLPYRWELVLWLWVVFFFNQADRQLFGIVLPALKLDLHLTDVQAGLVASIFTATFACVIPFSGIAGDVAGSVAVDELDSIGDAELFSAESRLLGEQLAHVDAGAADSVIACPGAKHLARTAAEVEHTGPRFQAQRRSKSGELFGCERVMDAVSTFADVEDPWNVYFRNTSRV